MRFRSVLFCITLMAHGLAQAQAMVESDWVSYRDAYRQMIWFEKYGKPKQFLQSHYRVRLRDANGSTDGLRLTLDSKSAHLDLPLDAVGRAIFPFSKAAYDDNVQLTLNRKAGQFKFEPWVSIVSRTDGVYDAADLRVACEQMLAYLRYVGAAWVNGKACTGVQFAYAKNDSDAEVRFRKADHALQPLAVRDGPAFPGDAAGVFKTIAYRFAAFPEAGQIVTRSMPLAIAALIE